ncbi:MAG: alanine--tRNA ligase, partial [Ignavibacteria bacterium]
GMGFERVVSVLQNKKTNYETDVFLPLIDELIQITGKDYTGEKFQSSMNVIADHVRALTFAIADGAIPSNEGRGYVLRRILRRAARYGRNLGMKTPFIFTLVDVLVNTMGHVFPEIIEKQKFIKEVIQSEEENFNETLDRGLVFFNEEIENMKTSGSKIFSGDVAFKLHDTYGFPVDLTQLIAREAGYGLDTDKFNALMNVQKERARSERRNIILETKTGDIKLTGFAPGLSITHYDPYHIAKVGIKSKIIGEKSLDKEHGIIYLEKNPFYSESGGQVSDTGKLIIGNRELKVIDSKINYVVVDTAEVNLNQNTEVIALVDYDRRLAVQRNHSATHLVHEALRRVLGPHVKQMGSYLDDKVLRFDFPHFHKPTADEIKRIEGIVNDKIEEEIGVNYEIMPIEKAEKIPNVKKFFGEKYGDEVRVVFIDEKFSVEFCGGTHVQDTSDIGLFKIIKEESISSGVRRIFARTGEGIINLIDEKVKDIETILGELPEKYASGIKSGLSEFKSNFKEVDFKDRGLLAKLIEYQDLTFNSLMDLREKYIEDKKKAEKELAKLKVKSATSMLDAIISGGINLDGIKVVSSKFDVNNIDELKEIGDNLRLKLSSGVALIYSVIEGKINLVTVVSDDLIKEKGLNAGKLAGDFAKLVGGGGGGKPHLATAGGKDVDKLDSALSEFKSIVKKYLK